MVLTISCTFLSLVRRKRRCALTSRRAERLVFAGKAPEMDWVRPFADGFVGGKWLGYAQTHE